MYLEISCPKDLFKTLGRGAQEANGLFSWRVCNPNKDYWAIDVLLTKNSRNTYTFESLNQHKVLITLMNFFHLWHIDSSHNTTI